MIGRCYRPEWTNYKDYGGRGIQVCPEWRASFATFYADMGERPAGMSIERVDNNRGYERGNCIWAPREVQVRNKRNNRYIWIDGEKMTLAEGSRVLGLSPTKYSVSMKPNLSKMTMWGGRSGPRPNPRYAEATSPTFCRNDPLALAKKPCLQDDHGIPTCTC